jgi:hypothetical protein
MRSRTREWRCMDTRWKRDALRVAPATAIAQMSVSIEYLLKGGHRARPLRSTVQHREYVPVTFPSCSTVIPRTNIHTLPSCAIHD